MPPVEVVLSSRDPNVGPPPYRNRAGNCFTTTVGTSSSSLSTNAINPSGPNAAGMEVALGE